MDVPQSLPFKAHGFTLLEMMMALLISLVLVTLVAPAFSELSYNTHRSAALNQFVTLLHFVRSEATKRRSNVIFCLSIDQQNCAAGSVLEWQKGIVFEDLDNDRLRDADEPILQTFEAADLIDIYASSSSRRKLRYMADGTAPGSTTTVRFCDPQRRYSPRALILANTGRPRVSEYDADGNALSCP